MTLTAAIVAFVNAVLALVTNFGVSLTDNQKGTITGLVNAALVLGAIAYDQWHGIHKTSLPTAPTEPGP